ncbi:MAG: hypothetical protein IPP50_08955 [Piscinibacter sp.]|nr:hypothetical protein [Piscinibacter sp.]
MREPLRQRRTAKRANPLSNASRPIDCIEMPAGKLGTSTAGRSCSTITRVSSKRCRPIASSVASSPIGSLKGVIRTISGSSACA